jgi:hypothetical protein
VCKILFKVLQMIEESYEAQTELAGRWRQRFTKKETKVNTYFEIQIWAAEVFR